MDPARIAALLEPFLDRPLATPQLERISTYIDLLLRWNARINLTSIRDPEEIVPRHFGESFFLARHLFPQPERSAHIAGSDATTDSNAVSAPTATDLPRVLDLGSGAGFPGVPLKIWAPDVRLALVESNHRKAAFLREVARAVTLTNVDVFARRAETLSSPEFPKPGAVTFRAVENFERTLAIAATFLAPSSRLAILITTAQIPKLTTLPGLTWETHPVPQSQSRVLSIGVRV